MGERSLGPWITYARQRLANDANHSLNIHLEDQDVINRVYDTKSLSKLSPLV